MCKIGFIGMGNMAQALAKGFIATKKITANNVFAYAPNQAKLKSNAEEIGFNPVASLDELIKSSDLIFIACKPYQIESVFDEICNPRNTSNAKIVSNSNVSSDDANQDLSSDGDTGFVSKNADAIFASKSFVSIAAGWNYDTFIQKINRNIKIQCVMPNTPVMVGEGVFLLEKQNSFDENSLTIVKDLFSALGLVEVIESDLMGVATAISGCGPAFMDLIMESFADAACVYGISRSVAYKLVSQTMLGSAKLQLETAEHPGVLKDKVCSPRGVTIKGVAELEKKGLRGTIISCIDAVLGK